MRGYSARSQTEENAFLPAITLGYSDTNRGIRGTQIPWQILSVDRFRCEMRPGADSVVIPD